MLRMPRAKFRRGSSLTVGKETEYFHWDVRQNQTYSYDL
jgi:hypothetical protein